MIAPPLWAEQEAERNRIKREQADNAIADMDKNTYLAAIALGIAAYVFSKGKGDMYRLALTGAGAVAGYLLTNEYYRKDRNELVMHGQLINQK